MNLKAQIKDLVHAFKYFFPKMLESENCFETYFFLSSRLLETFKSKSKIILLTLRYFFPFKARFGFESFVLWRFESLKNDSLTSLSISSFEVKTQILFTFKFVVAWQKGTIWRPTYVWYSASKVVSKFCSASVFFKPTQANTSQMCTLWLQKRDKSRKKKIYDKSYILVN